MNRPIRRVAVGCLVLFLALLLSANYVQVIDAGALNSNPHNSQVLIDQYARQRGPILVDGTAIAESKPTSGPLKYTRVYPFGAEYAAVTGYDSLTLGETGLEAAYNSLLSGNSSALTISRLTSLLTGQQPQGAILDLTLNPAAQKAAYDGLKGLRGAVVALDPKTGAILALVTSPSFNPTPLASHNTATIQKAYQQLLTEPGRPLIDRATQTIFPPGSLFKIVTASAALSSGKYSVHEQIPSPQYLHLPDTTHVLHNYAYETCGPNGLQTFIHDFAISCDSAFADVGLHLGAATLGAQAAAFGIGRIVPNFPLPQAPSVFPSNPPLPDLAYSAIGQYNVALTPLQAAMIVSAIADHGTEMTPYLVSEVQAPDLTVIQRTHPTVFAHPVSPQIAAEVTQLMIAVVQYGTGQGLGLPGIQVAAKTGTAQHGHNQPPHAWFGAFAPAGNPQVAVVAFVEDGGGSLNATGAGVAGPIAQAVLRAVLAPNGSTG